MATINVSIPEEMITWINEQVQAGHFSDVSELVQVLIQKNRFEKAALQQALVEGEASGKSEKTVVDILEEQKRLRQNA